MAVAIAVTRERRTGETRCAVTPEQASALAEAGLQVFADRTVQDGAATAYLCEGVVCRLPTTDAEELAAALSA